MAVDKRDPESLGNAILRIKKTHRLKKLSKAHDMLEEVGGIVGTVETVEDNLNRSRGDDGFLLRSNNGHKPGVLPISGDG